MSSRCAGACSKPRHREVQGFLSLFLCEVPEAVLEQLREMTAALLCLESKVKGLRQLRRAEAVGRRHVCLVAFSWVVGSCDPGSCQEEVADAAAAQEGENRRNCGLATVYSKFTSCDGAELLRLQCLAGL